VVTDVSKVLRTFMTKIWA